MAELLPQGKQLTRSHKPSGLRNEIKSDLTDDEMLQVPDSDIMVPETQIEQDEGFGGIDHEVDKQSNGSDDDEMDPADATIIAHNKAKRSVNQTDDHTQFSFPPLSKVAFDAHRGAVSPSSFVFAQAPSSRNKRASKVKADLHPSIAVSHSRPVVQKVEEQIQHDHDQVTVPTVCLTPRELTGLQQDAAIPDSLRYPGDRSFSLHATNLACSDSKAEYNGADSSETKWLVPPSAQPGSNPVNSTRKIRAFKRVRKCKKEVLTQQCDGPWPDRTSIFTGFSSQASQQDEPDLLAVKTKTSRHLLDRDPYTQIKSSQYTSVQAAPSSPYSETTAQKSRMSESENVDQDFLQSGKELTPFTPNKPQQLSQCIPDTVSQSLLPLPEDHSSVALFEQLASPIKFSDQVIPHLHKSESALTSTHHLVEGGIATAVPNDRPGGADPEGCPSQVVSELVHHSITGQKAEQEPVTHRTASEAALRDTAGCGTLFRVTKPQKKVRTINGSLPHHPQGSMMAVAVESSLAALRLSWFAEESRKEQEHATTVRHHEEINDLLQSQLSMKDVTIQEMNEKQRNLGGTVTRLAERAKTNQKYVFGLQRDYEKLQNSVTAFQKQSKKTLQDKITELEAERSSLSESLNVTLDSVSRSQRNMRTTIEGLYTDLFISEFKRKDLVEDLNEQTKMCQEEQTRRDRLEMTLLVSTQSIQRQLNDSYTNLTTMLVAIDSSTKTKSSHEALGIDVQKCLKALESLQSKPVSNTTDIETAEGMLQSVHERISTGLESLSSEVKSQLSFPEDLQKYISCELQSIRTEILQHDELADKVCKANEVNASLTGQLEAQQQHCHTLDGRINVLQESEGDLKRRSSQLERELEDLETRPRDSSSRWATCEQELLTLRQQLKEAEDALMAVTDSMEQSAKLRQELEETSAAHKMEFQAVSDRLRKANTKKQQQETPEIVADIRKKIAIEYQKEFREKESAVKNEIHRLTMERNEEEAARQAMYTELTAAKEQLYDLRKDTKSLIAELELLRGEKNETEKKMNNMQGGVSATLSTSLQILALQESLQQKTEELQNCTHHYGSLQQQVIGLTNRASELQISNDRLQALTEQQSSKLETSRQQADDRLSEAQNRSQMALQLAQDQISGLHNEKQEVIIQLEKARSSEIDLKTEQVACLNQKEVLQGKLNELRGSIDAREAEKLQTRADAAEERQRLAAEHQVEIDNWNNRQAQTDTALKEAEASIRRMEDEHRAKLEYDHKLAAKELADIQIMYEAKLQAAKVQLNQVKQHDLRTSGSEDTSGRPLPDFQAGLGRKRVNRQNLSVLDLTGSSIHLNDRPLHAVQNQSLRNQRQTSDMTDDLFRENAGAEDVFDSYDKELKNPTQGHISDTQDMSMFTGDFNEDLNQLSSRKTRPHEASSTCSSSLNSDDLMQMGKDVEDVPIEMLRGHDRSIGTQRSPEMCTRETAPRSDKSVSGSSSSPLDERPKSQANTASRLMPPPGATSGYFGSSSQDENHAQNVKAQHPSSKKLSLKLHTNGNTSSLDPKNSSSSTTKKHIYGRKDFRLLDYAGFGQDTSTDLGHGHNQKRKPSEDHVTRSIVAKKPRTSSQFQSQSVSRNSVPTIQAHQFSKSTTRGSTSKTQLRSPSIAPHSSTQSSSSSVLYKSRGQKSGSYQARGVESTCHDSSRRPRTKTQGAGEIYDDRFDQELGSQ